MALTATRYLMVPRVNFGLPSQAHEKLVMQFTVTAKIQQSASTFQQLLISSMARRANCQPKPEILVAQACQLSKLQWNKICEHSHPLVKDGLLEVEEDYGGTANPRFLCTGKC